MRIAKMIARAGVCSRRDAEKLILDGKVSVNGRRIDSPALNVGAKDRILIDGKPLPVAEPVRLWRYHKPRGLVTSHKDPEGRKTVFKALPDGLPRVISVGRLDYNTEGLLLITTDGDLARHLELPATGWSRRYKARAFGRVTQADLDTLKKGVTIDGVSFGPISARLERDSGPNPWISLSLSEGKNREVRKVLEHFGLKVSRLIRLSYGPLQLGDLKSGQVEEVKSRVLAEQLGEDLAQRLQLRPAKPAGGGNQAGKEAAKGGGRAKAKIRTTRRPPIGGKHKPRRKPR